MTYRWTDYTWPKVRPPTEPDQWTIVVPPGGLVDVIGLTIPPAWMNKEEPTILTLRAPSQEALFDWLQRLTDAINTTPE